MALLIQNARLPTRPPDRGAGAGGVTCVGGVTDEGSLGCSRRLGGGEARSHRRKLFCEAMGRVREHPGSSLFAQAAYDAFEAWEALGPPPDEALDADQEAATSRMEAAWRRGRVSFDVVKLAEALERRFGAPRREAFEALARRARSTAPGILWEQVYAAKHQGKGRRVVSELASVDGPCKADAIVGRGHRRIKSVQLKMSTAKSLLFTAKNIAKAVRQSVGLNGERPPSDAALVAHISVINPFHRWNDEPTDGFVDYDARRVPDTICGELEASFSMVPERLRLKILGQVPENSVPRRNLLELITEIGQVIHVAVNEDALEGSSGDSTNELQSVLRVGLSGRPDGAPIAVDVKVRTNTLTFRYEVSAERDGHEVCVRFLSVKSAPNQHDYLLCAASPDAPQTERQRRHRAPSAWGGRIEDAQARFERARCKIAAYMHSDLPDEDDVVLVSIFEDDWTDQWRGREA